MSDQSIRRKTWRAKLRHDRQLKRQYWNEYCLRCGYKRKYHGQYHTYGMDGPGPWSRELRACKEFMGDFTR